MMALILGILFGGGGAAAIWYLAQSSAGAGTKIIAALESELKQREEVAFQFRELYATLIDVPSFIAKGQDLRSAQEALKAERGRITITQAELETVETRLRELDEIERELEASGLETKEEMKILQKKHVDIDNRNKVLREKIDNSNQQLDELLAQVQMSVEAQAQIQAMREQLISTQAQLESLSVQIAQSNEHYFVLKRRYDALDIEYAQLYEKFSEVEAAMAAARDKAAGSTS